MRYGSRTVADYYRDLAQRQQRQQLDEPDQQGGQQVQAGGGREGKKAD